MRRASGYTPRDVERWLHWWCLQNMRGEWRGRNTVFGKDLHPAWWNELSDAELFMLVECTFGASLPADRVYRTVGDVCDGVIEAIPRQPYACDGCHLRTFHRIRRILIAADIPRRMVRRTTPLIYLRSFGLPSLRPFFRWVDLRGRFASIGGLVHDLAADDYGGRLPSQAGPGAARLRA